MAHALSPVLSRRFFALAALAAPLVLATPAAGQELYDFGSAFGRAAAVASGDLLVAEPQVATRPGAVHVFQGADAWSRAQTLRGSAGHRGDGFGRAVAAAGRLAVVGAPGDSDGAGAAYVFRRGASGWEEGARLAAPSGSAGFGSAVAVADGAVAVTGRSGEREAVHVLAADGTRGWRPTATLTGDAGDGRFGAALAFIDELLVVCGADGNGQVILSTFRATASGWSRAARVPVNLPFSGGPGLLAEDPYLQCALDARGDVVALGSPAAEGRSGVVTLFRRAPDGGLVPESRLAPFQVVRGQGFGMSVAFSGDALWVGAPRAGGDLGVAYRFDRGPEGMWSSAARVTGRGQDFMPVFSLSLAGGDDVAVLGAPGDDYGAGTALVYRRSAAGWGEAAELSVEPEQYAAVTGARKDCTAGEADVFGCSGVDLVSFLPVDALGGDRGTMVNDVWGWTDPETGREYAVVGRSDGTSFVDVTDGTAPRYLGNLPKTEGSRGNAWRDVKVIRDHALVVADNAGQHGMQVFDLTRLRDVSEPTVFDADALYTDIASAHNLIVNEETGFAFTVGNSGGGRDCGSIHMIDMRDPKNPTFAGCYTDPAVGMTGSGSTHDAQCLVYRGPDGRFQGREICIGFSETALTVGDVTDKDAPRVLAQGRYPGTAYTHQGWFDDEQRYLYVNDELDEMVGTTTRTRTLIWDLSELDDPVLAGEYLGETRATDHNLYVVGDLMYQSNYAAGLRLIDITDREAPREVGFFDTAPFAPDEPGFFDGSWSNYPFFSSGKLIVTSHHQGLFVLEPRRPIS